MPRQGRSRRKEYSGVAVVGWGEEVSICTVRSLRSESEFRKSIWLVYARDEWMKRMVGWVEVWFGWFFLLDVISRFFLILCRLPLR